MLSYHAIAAHVLPAAHPVSNDPVSRQQRDRFHSTVLHRDGISPDKFPAFRLGLASFIGNLVPIGVAFGAWAMINGNIDVGLTVVLGIAFSVVVDDTIHFISKYERARQVEGKSQEDAVRYAFSHVGFALLSTTAVLGSGYAWLANSAIQLTVNTATVTVTTIGIALLIDVFMLPSLFLVLDKRKGKAG